MAGCFIHCKNVAKEINLKMFSAKMEAILFNPQRDLNEMGAILQATFSGLSNLQQTPGPVKFPPHWSKHKPLPPKLPYTPVTYSEHHFWRRYGSQCLNDIRNLSKTLRNMNNVTKFSMMKIDLRILEKENHFTPMRHEQYCQTQWNLPVLAGISKTLTSRSS